MLAASFYVLAVSHKRTLALIPSWNMVGPSWYDGEVVGGWREEGGNYVGVVEGEDERVRRIVYE